MRKCGPRVDYPKQREGVEELGAAPEIRPRYSQEWIREGFDLGNHTYSHPDISVLSAEQIKQEIVRGESTIEPLMKEAGKKLTFFAKDDAGAAPELRAEYLTYTSQEIDYYAALNK